MNKMKSKLLSAICLVLLCAVTAACGIESSVTPSKVGNVTKEQTSAVPATKQSTEAPLKDVYQVGDVVEVNNTKMVYTASGEYDSSNSYMQPGDGNKYIFLEFYVEYLGSGSTSVSYFDFDAYADGYAVDQIYTFDNALSGTISTGRWNLGRLYYEVPENAAEIEVEYEYNILSSKKLKFAYEGIKDSGFVPEAKTKPTDGAFKPGDIVDAGKFKISYLSCDYFESDNMFIQPDEGNVFIYLEFEFENTSDSDRSVNSLFFNCYADGKVCSGTTMRDDDLSASISPGRKAKGTISFQVPKDASVVEVEFVDNLFMGNATVFSFEK